MAEVGSCLYRKRSRALLDCARSKGNNWGSRRIVERQLRRHARRSLPHSVPADRQRYDSSSAAAKHSEIPGPATVKSRQTMLVPAPGASSILYRPRGGEKYERAGTVRRRCRSAAPGYAPAGPRIADRRVMAEQEAPSYAGFALNPAPHTAFQPVARGLHCIGLSRKEDVRAWIRWRRRRAQSTRR